MLIQGWQLWTCDTVLKAEQLSGDTKPLLDCFNANSDPAQVRLQKYLDEIEKLVGPLPSGDGVLFLHMDVDVELRKHLEKHHDVENYLAPVVRRLGYRHFKFVSGRKQVGGGSRLVIGWAKPLSEETSMENWRHVQCHPGSGRGTTAWKDRLREC